MKRMKFLSNLTLGVALAAASLIATPAVAADHDFQAQRVLVESGKSFDDVAKAVKNLVAKNGMMVMAEVDQGKMLSMAGMQLKAKLFLIGNPMVGKQLFEQNRAVGLYVPLRLSVFTDSSGKTFLEYDKPSSLLMQFKSDQINMVGKMLDEKIGGLAQMAAQ